MQLSITREKMYFSISRKKSIEYDVYCIHRKEYMNSFFPQFSKPKHSQYRIEYNTPNFNYLCLIYSKLKFYSFFTIYF